MTGLVKLDTTLHLFLYLIHQPSALGTKLVASRALLLHRSLPHGSPTRGGHRLATGGWIHTSYDHSCKLGLEQFQHGPLIIRDIAQAATLYRLQVQQLQQRCRLAAPGTAAPREFLLATRTWLIAVVRNLLLLLFQSYFRLARSIKATTRSFRLCQVLFR